MTELELLTAGNYFKSHPENILGVEAKGTTKWGEEITIVKKDSSIDEIAKRIIGEGINPEPQPWHLIAGPAYVSPKDKIAEAIRKTKEAISHPPSNTGHDLYSFSEVQEKWGSGITDAEKKVWVWYNNGRMFSYSAIGKKENGWSDYIEPVNDATLNKWAKAGLVGFNGREFIPAALFFAGNIYQRIELVKRGKEEIEKRLGEKFYKDQLAKLDSAKPVQLKITASESERVYISPLDPFVSETFIEQLADGTVFESAVSLLNAYKQWLRGLPDDDFKAGSDSYAIINYWIERDSFPRNTTPEEKVDVKRRAQQDGMALFSRFLFEMLTRLDQQIIEHRWNSVYNAFKEYDYSRIPIGFEMNRWFKNGPIDPRPALWDGVKFLGANGSGIVAFDVGVGKTMTAILAVAQAVYTGQCKRPLIVVPNPTYKKWISETVGEFDKNGKCIVNGVLPQYKDRINDFYNLGVEHESKLADLWPKDYTITFITYEGLMKLGFSEATRTTLEAELYKILNQGELKARDVEKLREQIDATMGGITANTIANFDDMGFDYIVVDEAHNFKKIFTRVKGRVEKGGEDRAASPYQLSSGEPSGRGLKLFALSQYVLRNNAMRNVILLTATPFTNSPLEIYSMLALVAYQQLEERGISNLIDFFDKFINEENELSVTVKGTLEVKPVIKTFQNRQLLQNIIFSSIIYKTGEEAGVPRPHKIVYPMVKDAKGLLLSPEDAIETALPPTPEQKKWLREIAKFANNETGNIIEPHIPRSMYDERNNLLGRDLIAISLAKNVTLSPYLLRVAGTDIYEEANPTYLEYVQSSPKLQYTMKCLESIRNWHLKRNEPVSGAIIYMNMATEYFYLIKEYLVKKVGYEAAEVEVIIGGISQDKKERIKEKFLKGDIKIIIGSATIREGIDLQTRTTCLFNLALDWNPTDIQQLEGRAWRQGNIHSYVRIVTPLIENSLDVFMFQKLEEKTSRINDIWYRAGRGNVLKIEDFDPQELKLGLMTDPKEKVKAELKIEVQKLQLRKKVVEGTIEKLQDATKTIKEVVENGKSINTYYENAFKALKFDLNGIVEQLTLTDISKTTREELESRERSLNQLLNREQTDKVKMAVCRRYAKKRLGNAYSYWGNPDYEIISTCDKQEKAMATLDSITKNILEPKGLTMADNLQPLIEENEAERQSIEDKIKELESPAYFDAKVDEATAEMSARSRFSRSVDERVKQFERHNHLLSCLKDVHICSPDNPLIAERPAVQPVSSSAPDNDKRLRIAKAKAAALKLKLQLQQTEKQAA